MKLALYQGAAPDGDVEGAFGRIERFLHAASLAGAKMLVMPELFLPGYNRPDLHRTLAQPRGGDWCQRLSRAAGNAGCGLTIGWAERQGDNVYNAATAFGPDGAELAHYRKIQLFGPMEAASFCHGQEGHATFELEGRRAGLLICYDVEFPHHVAALRDQGAEILLVPTANPAGYEHVQRLLVPTRAYEARSFIAYANYCGEEAGLSYGGLSLIAGPDGGVIASAGLTEALLIAEIPPLNAYRQDRLSTQHLDRRGA